MRQGWRWFGPQDKVTLADARQAGVECVVTALHHVPTGEIWRPEEIEKRQREVAFHPDGAMTHLAWDVVESLPVSEAIKTQSGDWRAHIVHYRRSLENLARAGISTICYNFMPVLDWTRTDLAWRVPHGGTAMRFDLADFAAFDIHILKRKGAAEGYPETVLAEADKRFARMDDDAQRRLAANVVAGLPGAVESWTLESLAAQLETYRGIGPDRLRRNLIDFLSDIVPDAQRLGMRLACHPDDPPFPLLGLPRVMSTEADYRAVLDAVASPANGVTLCTGSLGARPDNDLPGMAARLAPQVHFVHLRNVRRDDEAVPCSFFEDEHLAGQTDMVAVVAALLGEERRRRSEGRADAEIVMRPDHGQDILDDLKRGAQPGYPAIGRLKGLAELRGVMAALNHAGSSS
ncbi:mannonate dehydratase [Nitratireductor mangrovi]|uniref:Mannonate dehydratase n=1 Tax=Nitratireductor mangrovi TaxID=2599600 RepID=A0A5B8L1A1_9HYPH|nr:mannonate dehydratase [Nitratireductor mangrovi]QDZ01442.1 mannonate dehydratase [Nitratireductor mangrovi]